MRKVSVVIGANYGDEGKGLFTDYLASKSKSIVVRFNSGAQAGHTVVTPEGNRHVFHHVGAGSFTGAPTFLTKFFAINPLVFNKEIKELKEIGCTPFVCADPGCLITTPYDILLNQAIEKKRGEGKHGSCGMGFGETIERSEEERYRLTYGMDSTNAHSVIYKIRTEYIPRRMKELGIEEIPLLNNENLFNNFLKDLFDMKQEVTTIPWHEVPEKFHLYNIIFEGAQGLLLDMDGKDFPHVTRSKTGLYNITRYLLRKAGLENEKIDVYYITRSYLTRHGAGPLSYELSSEYKPYGYIEDRTNINNEFQGSLRFSYLDNYALYSRIKNDFDLIKGFEFTTKNLVITCCDQTDDDAIKYWETSKVIESDIDIYCSVVKDLFSLDKVYTSYGPTRQMIKEVK